MATLHLEDFGQAVGSPYRLGDSESGSAAYPHRTRTVANPVRIAGIDDISVQKQAVELNRYAVGGDAYRVGQIHRA
jgi:hypothetical protein